MSKNTQKTFNGFAAFAATMHPEVNAPLQGKKDQPKTIAPPPPEIPRKPPQNRQSGQVDRLTTPVIDNKPYIKPVFPRPVKTFDAPRQHLNPLKNNFENRVTDAPKGTCTVFEVYEYDWIGQQKILLETVIIFQAGQGALDAVKEHIDNIPVYFYKEHIFYVLKGFNLPGKIGFHKWSK